MSEEVICNITPPNSPTFEGHVTNQDNSSEVDLEHENALTLRCFVCLGDAKLDKINLHAKSYIQKNETEIFNETNFLNKQHKATNIQYESLFKNRYDLATVFLNPASIFRALRSEILYLHDAAKLSPTNLHTLADFHGTKDYQTARQNCTRTFMCLRKYLCCLDIPQHGWIVNNILPKIEEQLNGFRLFLRRLSDLPEYILHHSAHTQGEKCTEAAYHLFHGQLDVLWLHLTSVYLVDRCHRAVEDEALSQPSSVSTAPDKLDEHIRALIADLVQLSVIRFEKMDVRSLLIKSPFNCSCVAELWMLVSVMANRLHNQGITKSFWTNFNKVMEQFLKPRCENIKNNCRSLVEVVTQSCSNPFGFSLWLLKHIAMVQAQDECRTDVPLDNYRLLDTVVKGLLSPDLSEAHLRVYLSFMEKILIKYWEPDPKPIVLLWEYFQKRLNSTFYVPGSSVDSIAIVSQSVAGMVKQVKSRLSGKAITDNSFHMFLRILGLFLQKVSANAQNQLWNQLRGRIYSKLSSAKVLSLNETGLYHLVALFLTMAVTADLNEVSKKLQSLLAGRQEVELDSGTRRVVWRSHLAVCLLLVERGQDVTAAVAPVTDSLAASQADVALCRTYLDGLRDLLDCGATLKVNFTKLIGPWIPKYLAECSPNDSSRLLETLESLLLRVQSQPTEQEKFQSSVWQHLSPYLRRRVCEDNAPLQLADVCLHLCLPDWDIGREVVHLLLLNNTTHISLVRRFLWRVVESREVLGMLQAAPCTSPEAHEVLILKSWLRCSLLSLDYTSCELSRVTDYITNLPFIASICMDLPSASDPLVHFIVNLSNKLKTSQDICEKGNMRQVMSRVLTGLDRWVESVVRQPKTPELTSRVYHVVGLIVQLLPTFVYVKSRPNTVLKGLLDVMFLPQAAYKPDYDPPLKPIIAGEIHLFMNGLFALNKMKDSYIERCIQDLTRIYLPMTGQQQCKLVECVGQAAAADSVKLFLNTICITFIKRKTANPHPGASQALRFIRSAVRLYARDRLVLLLCVDQCFEYVCDVVMFCDDYHNTKNIAREVMTLIFESPCFGDELSVKILEKFDKLSSEYIAFLPKKLFALFLEVVRMRPELVLRYLPKLQGHVRTVELKRGIPNDQSLRVHLEELEHSLKAIRKGSS